MDNRWRAAGAALVLTLFSSLPAKALSLDFEIDVAGSNVEVTSAADGFVCSITSCGVEGSLASGLGGTFTLGEGDTETFDFLTFTGSGFGGTILNVEATLAFLEPAGANTSSSGFGAAALFNGSIVSGVLTWNDVPAAITLADGSEITVDFQDGFTLLAGGSVTTSASVTADSIAVPLPGALPLLAGGLGLLGLAGWRRRRTANAV